MKDKEVPPALMWGGLAVVLLVIAAVSYSMFFKAPPQIDAAQSVSAERLRDPDPPRMNR